MDTDLEPDRIGRIGERKFEDLCERAGLICNQSSVDVMGWDFIVEFPVPLAGANLPLDQRPTNGARVQLKSTLGRSGHRIKLSLSSINLLAKDPRPAIIVVFRLRDDGELVAGYIVHLIGKELARILHRLRMAEAQNAPDINRVEISYDYEKVGKRFAPTHDALREALADACGDDPAGYTIEKRRQLDELGYEDGRFEAEAIVYINGPEHLNALMLGLVPLKPQHLQVYDKRFNIRVPYQGTLFDDIGELRLTPPSLGSCEVSIRGPGFGQAARFDAEMFIGPPVLGDDGPELLIRHTDFIIRFSPGGLKFETLEIFEGAKRGLSEWAELARGLCLLGKGSATLTLSGNTRIPEISLSIPTPLTGPYIEDLPTISAFMDGWARLLAGAGLRSEETFAFDAFWDAINARLAVDILLNPKSTARFELQTIDPKEPAETVDGLYFNNCAFAGTALTYCARTTFQRTSDETWQYRSVAFEALDVRPQVEDLEEYSVDQATAHDLTLLINPNSMTMTNRAN